MLCGQNTNRNILTLFWLERDEMKMRNNFWRCVNSRLDLLPGESELLSEKILQCCGCFYDWWVWRVEETTVLEDSHDVADELAQLAIVVLFDSLFDCSQIWKYRKNTTTLHEGSNSYVNLFPRFLQCCFRHLLAALLVALHSCGIYPCLLAVNMKATWHRKICNSPMGILTTL